MKSIVAVSLIVISSSAFSADIVEESKKSIGAEISEYKEKGISGFVTALSKASPMMEGDKSVESQLTGSMTSIEAICGKAIGYSIRTISKLSDDSANALFIINLEKCPLFARQVFYRTNAGKISSPSFYFNPQPEQAWPADVIFQTK